jgi:Tfp pilus assembly protein PilF/TolB-like protein
MVKPAARLLRGLRVGSRKMWRTFILVLVVLGVPVLGLPGSAQAPAPATSSRVLVLPFENPTRDPKLYWLTEGAAVLLTDELIARGVPAISRDTRLDAFERLQVPPVATLSRATVIRLGELVGAGEVIIGSVALAGDTLAVQARRMQLEPGRLDQDRSDRGPLADLFSIFARLALRVSPAAANAVAPIRQPPPPAAFENYVKGLMAEPAATQIAFLQAAIKAAAGFDQARVALWDAFTEQGEHAQALDVALQVTESSRERREAQFLAALSEIQLTRYPSAFTRLTALQKEAPSPAILNNVGVVQLRRGATPETGRATFFFDGALKAAPEDSDYAFNLGYAYWIERDPQAAIYWLREAVKLNPADGEAHAVLAAALQGSGAPTEAMRERELARQLSSEYAEWEKRPSAAAEPVPRRLERLMLHSDRSRTDSIDLALLAREQREQREVAAFHLDRGRRFFDQGLDREAIAELRRSLYLSPYQADAHLLLGRLYLRNGRVTEAIDVLTISVWSQETADARIALAEAYVAGADPVAARREIDRALVLAPDSAAARGVLQRLTAPQTSQPK